MKGLHLHSKADIKAEVEDDLVMEMLNEDWRLTSALLFLSSKLKEAEWRLAAGSNLAHRKICLGKIVPGDVWEVWEEYLNGQELAGHSGVVRWELEQNVSGCFFLVECGPTYLARATFRPQHQDRQDSIIRWLHPRRWDQCLLASIRNPILRKLVRKLLRIVKGRSHTRTASEMALRRKRFCCLLSAMINQATRPF